MELVRRIARDALTPRHGLAAFVDVETTGLHPARHEVVELAVVLFAFDRETGTLAGIVDEYTGLRDPGRPIPPDATAIHGIDDTMVRGRRLDDRRVRALLAEAEFLVAHNARFDHGFVCRLYPEAAAKPWLCSLHGIAWHRHGHRARGLQALLAAHGIAVEAAHRAGADCRAAVALLGRTGPHGDTYLRELLRSWTPAGDGAVVVRGAVVGARVGPGVEPAADAGDETDRRRRAAGCMAGLVLVLGAAAAWAAATM